MRMRYGRRVSLSATFATVSSFRPSAHCGWTSILLSSSFSARFAASGSSSAFHAIAVTSTAAANAARRVAFASSVKRGHGINAASWAGRITATINESIEHAGTCARPA